MGTTLALLFLNATNSFGLPPNLLASVCYVESNYNIDAVHYQDGDGNSLGICQIKYKTAHWLGFEGTEEELMDPEINIYYAAKYLHHHITRYKDIPRALTAYNKGNAKGLTDSAYSRKVLSIYYGR